MIKYFTCIRYLEKSNSKKPKAESWLSGATFARGESPGDG